MSVRTLFSTAVLALAVTSSIATSGSSADGDWSSSASILVQPRHPAPEDTLDVMLHLDGLAGDHIDGSVITYTLDVDLGDAGILVATTWTSDNQTAEHVFHTSGTHTVVATNVLGCDYYDVATDTCSTPTGLLLESDGTSTVVHASVAVDAWGSEMPAGESWNVTVVED